MHYVALRKESVDRNVPGQNLVNGIGLSLSARRAWIEMTPPQGMIWSRPKVALRKESVDRNLQYCWPYLSSLTVALRKESVDRNQLVAGSLTMFGGSLSARRAWIEIAQSRRV